MTFLALRRVVSLSAGQIRTFKTARCRQVEGTAQDAISVRPSSTDPGIRLDHIPVMATEVVNFLEPRDGQVIIDMTFGAGGHSKRILEAASNVKIYALDRDSVAFERARELAELHPGRLVPILGRFSDLGAILQRHGLPLASVDGMLFDVGVSSMQMDDPKRGFSISRNGPLDMRMDGTRSPNQVTAYDLLHNIDEESLSRILKVYGEEKFAKQIAHALVTTKYNLRSITTTHDLAEVVKHVLDCDKRFDKLQRPTHAATKVFQAIRIFVNNELNELNHGMELAHQLLRDGGRVVAVTFHSLEDRIVKRHMQGIDMDERISSTLSQKYRNSCSWHSPNEVAAVYSGRWTPINRRVVLPSEEEVRVNPRSRSAKLRAAIKNATDR